MVPSWTDSIIGLLEQAALEYEFDDVSEVAAELGIRGVLHRLGGGRVEPGPPGERVYSALWDHTLMDAKADLDRLLGGAGVSYLVYKGGGLLGSVYEPGDVRIADLDVLVPHESRAAARAAMTAGGWAAKEPVGGPALPGAPGTVFGRPFGDDAISALDVDVHWRITPVERLFPWKGSPIPGDVFEAGVPCGGVRVPRPGHHAALLVHHFVRHDLLHFRSAFDVIQLWPSLQNSDEARAFFDLADRFGVGRAARGLCGALERDLAMPALGADRTVAAGASSVCSVGALVGLALAASEQDVEAVTPQRALRRIRTVDRGARAARTLATDALFPPDVYLRWRWPGSGVVGRRFKHAGRVLSRLHSDTLQAPPDDPPDHSPETTI